MEGIKTEKLNPEHIADLAASLNQFLAQTTRNGHLSGLDSHQQTMSDVGDESLLMSCKFCQSLDDIFEYCHFKEVY